MTLVFLWGKLLQAALLPLEKCINRKLHLAPLTSSHANVQCSTADNLLTGSQPVYQVLGGVNEPRIKMQRRRQGLCTVLLSFCHGVP